MRISNNWLRRYVDVTASPEEIAERLTMVGLEVENVEQLGEIYQGFIVGEVLSVTKHPDADKLTVCKVNVGGEILQIVCGAPNVIAHQQVAVGLVGSVVPRNQHDPGGAPVKLSHVRLRGQDSFGMICSEYELGLGDDKDGILVLDRGARPGTPLADFLGVSDIVFEIGVTPNRSDAMSHIGIAREVGMIFGKRLHLPAVNLREGRRVCSRFLAVRIEDKTNCPRYSARTVFGIRVAPSPKWISDSLTAVGIRPVNNVVDVTNYVLMEIGQPLHAFDYDQINGHSIIVRAAKHGDEFTTLDHKVRALTEETLMICDASRPIGIAGLMGGVNSEVTATTTNIILESAYFRPQSIRKSSKHLGLISDASQRFERGADPEITVWGLDRAAGLIRQICGGEVLKGAIDVYPKKIRQREVMVRPDKLNEILGVTLTERQICSLLSKLQIHPVKSRRAGHQQKKRIRFVIPSFRHDLDREIDLIEEVARVYGYDNIGTKSEAPVAFYGAPPPRDIPSELRTWLCGSGHNEIITNSMQELSVARLTSHDAVELSNPISKDMAALRTSLVPGALQVMRTNLFHGVTNLRLFEIGKKYFHHKTLPGNSIASFEEQNWLILAYSGLAHSASWDRKSAKVDLFDIKGEVQTLFKKIFLDKFKFIPYSTTNALTAKGLHIEINGEAGGYLGLISKYLLQQYEIEQDVYVAELNWDAVTKGLGRERKFEALQRFPSILRDIAVVVDEAMPAERIAATIFEAGRPLLVRVELFDIYRGDQIAQGKKSTAYALEFVSEGHTLTQEEIDRVVENIIRQARSRLNAEIRR